MDNFITAKQLKENKLLRHINSIFFIKYLLIFILLLTLFVQLLFFFFKQKIEKPPIIPKQEYDFAIANNKKLLQIKNDIAKARANHVDALGLINVVKEAMNENIWVKKTELTQNKISLEGNATNPDSLNTFFTNLKFSGYEQPILENTKVEQNIISFSITAEKHKGAKNQ